MIIKARVKTGQHKFSIARGEEWIISVRALPEGNKANTEIIKELSKRYSKARIVSGVKSKRKLLEIAL